MPWQTGWINSFDGIHKGANRADRDGDFVAGHQCEGIWRNHARARHQKASVSEGGFEIKIPGKAGEVALNAGDRRGTAEHLLP